MQDRKTTRLSVAEAFDAAAAAALDKPSAPPQREAVYGTFDRTLAFQEHAYTVRLAIEGNGFALRWPLEHGRYPYFYPSKLEVALTGSPTLLPFRAGRDCFADGVTILHLHARIGVGANVPPPHDNDPRSEAGRGPVRLNVGPVTTYRSTSEPRDRPDRAAARLFRYAMAVQDLRSAATKSYGPLCALVASAVRFVCAGPFPSSNAGRIRVGDLGLSAHFPDATLTHTRVM